MKPLIFKSQKIALVRCAKRIARGQKNYLFLLDCIVEPVGGNQALALHTCLLSYGGFLKK